MRLGLSSGAKCDGLPRLAQLVEHLTVVVLVQNVSADIRVSPVQVWERGPNCFILIYFNLFPAPTRERLY
jgi:hypothetical protein